MYIITNKYFLIPVMAFLCVFSANAMELSARFGAGNASFDQKAESALSAGGGGVFPAAISPLLRLSLESAVNENLSFRASLERDIILRNVLGAQARFKSGFLSVSAGPFFGLFNSMDNPIKPGLSAGLGLEFPGIIFLNFEAGSTLGSVKKGGDYCAESGLLSIGFWLPHIINTVSFSTKRYGEQRSGVLGIEDSLMRIQYSADIYSKSMSFTVRVDAGYQVLSREYSGASASQTDTLNMIFLGFETGIRVIPQLQILIGAEMPVYAWGKSPLSKPNSLVLWQATAGLSWTFGD